MNFELNNEIAEDCDIILNAFKTRSSMNIDYITSEIKLHNNNADYIDDLINLLRSQKGIVEYSNKFRPQIIATPLTLTFLRNGGFKRIHQDALGNEKRQKAEFKKLKYEAKLAEWKYKTYWLVAIAGIIGFLLSIYNTFWGK